MAQTSSTVQTLSKSRLSGHTGDDVVLSNHLRMTLSEEDVATLKCSKCSCYLNVPPIKSSLDGSVYQCGRCDFIVPTITVRNFAYEKLMKYMVFPCIYTGCLAKLIWSQIQQHEIECLYRTIPCPHIDCKADILCSKIIEHFEERHKSSVISDIAVRFYKLTANVDLSLLVHEGLPYFCMSSCNGNMFCVNVYSLRSKITHKYNLNLYTLTFQRRKISLLGEEIQLFNDRLHCIRCHSGKCTSLGHTKHNLFQDATSQIDVVSIRSILKSETVCLKVFIEANKNIQDNIETCDIIRRIAECVICKEFMSPPIHFCQTGHVICSQCQKKISKCPTCFASFVQARNFAIEELCSSVILRCQNASCDFIGNLKDLHAHEDKCDIQESKIATVESIAGVPLKNLL